LPTIARLASLAYASGEPAFGIYFHLTEIISPHVGSKAVRETVQPKTAPGCPSQPHAVEFQDSEPFPASKCGGVEFPGSIR
jgi:hypothetical protein